MSQRQTQIAFLGEQIRSQQERTSHPCIRYSHCLLVLHYRPVTRVGTPRCLCEGLVWWSEWPFLWSKMLEYLVPLGGSCLHSVRRKLAEGRMSLELWFWNRIPFPSSSLDLA